MQIIRVIFLILILVAPMGLASIVYLDRDKETCEILETLGEEEEDERSVEKIGGFDYFHGLFCEYSFEGHAFQQELLSYKNDNPFIYSLVRKVQTPPPKKYNVLA